MDKLDILVINWRDIRNPNAGGSEIHLQEVSSRWAKSGHNVTLFCSGFEGARKEERVEGVNVIRRGNRYSVYAHAVKYLLSRNRVIQYDVVFESINTIPFFTPRFSNCPVVAQIYSIDNKLVLSDELGRLMFPLKVGAHLALISIPSVYNDCEITTISRSSKQRLIANGFSEERIHIAYPGISETWIELVRSEPESDRPNFNIVYLGRLKKYKGIQDILRAIPSIRKRIPAIMFFVIGKGDYEPALRKLVGDLGIQDHVTFCGYVSEKEKASLLKSSSLFVCTSVDEGGWTIAAVEAMAAGVPLLVTYSQFDVLNSCSNGGLLRSDNPNEIADKVCSMLLNKSVWKTFSENAENFSRQFKWDRTAKVTFDALRKASF